jgi:hypothetical protein
LRICTCRCTSASRAGYLLRTFEPGGPNLMKIAVLFGAPTPMLVFGRVRGLIARKWPVASGCLGPGSAISLLIATQAAHPGIHKRRKAARKNLRGRRLSLEGQLRGQLPCLDFGYHSAIKRFRGFLVSPRPTIERSCTAVQELCQS